MIDRYFISMLNTQKKLSQNTLNPDTSRESLTKSLLLHSCINIQMRAGVNHRCWCSITGCHPNRIIPTALMSMLIRDVPNSEIMQWKQLFLLTEVPHYSWGGS